jgi:hypothetical protein
MDWMTLAIELSGLTILLVFIVIPVGEFKQIFRALRQRGKGPDA